MLLICISTKYAEKIKRNQVGEKLEKICSVQQEVKAHTSSDTKCVGIKPTFWS